MFTLADASSGVATQSRVHNILVIVMDTTVEAALPSPFVLSWRFEESDKPSSPDGLPFLPVRESPARAKADRAHGRTWRGKDGRA